MFRMYTVGEKVIKKTKKLKLPFLEHVKLKYC